MIIKEIRVTFTGRFTKKDQEALCHKVAEFANEEGLKGRKLVDLKRKNTALGGNDFRILFFLKESVEKGG